MTNEEDESNAVRPKEVEESLHYLEGIWGDYGRHEKAVKTVKDYIEWLEGKNDE